MLRTLFLIIVITAFSTAFGQSLEPDSAIKKEVQYDDNKQLNPIYFNQETIENFKSDQEYQYIETEKGVSFFQKFLKWLWNAWVDFWTWLFGENYTENSVLFFLFKYLPYFILLLIVIFIIWIFYKLNPGASILATKDKGEIFFTEEEAIIRSADIKSLIEQALNNKDYRLAIRFYYLLIIQKLKDHQHIVYEFDKTNSDYIKEIRQPTLVSDFKKATTLYDYIWYGNFMVNEQDFAKAKETFIALETQIIKERE